MSEIKANGSEQHTPTDGRSRTVQLENDASAPRAVKIPKILPHERVFPVQIGSELFKLSGASLSSDAPSYFSQYFKCQLENTESRGEEAAVRTLYIDRDPVTFRDISLHLQGYHIQPRDVTHFMRLFADAQFYSLPRLISQLYEESIFITIGHREFQIPRDLFKDPGNSPNFFSLGFAIFFSTPEGIFPGLRHDGLLRPPPIQPPSVPHRSADTFAEILHLLGGYPVRVRNETHRQELLRDCRYFNFKGLEQRLVPHTMAFNQARGRDDITMRLEDILRSGVAVAPEPSPADPLCAWVHYARPYVDDHACELVLEMAGECTRLHFLAKSYMNPSSSMHFAPSSFPHAQSVTRAGVSNGGDGHVNYMVRAEFFRDARARLARLLEVICVKLNLPPTTQPQGKQAASPGHTALSEDLVLVELNPETSIVLDGKPFRLSSAGAGAPGVEEYGGVAAGGTGTAGGYGMQEPSRKRKWAGSVGPGPGGVDEWMVKTGQWRLRIQGTKNGKAVVECVLVAVKLDVLSSEQARNAQRSFLVG